MFELTLSDIVATEEQLNEIKGFNLKYRFRFSIMHKKKIEEYDTRSSLSLASSLALTSSILSSAGVLEAENKGEQKKQKLEEKLKEIE